MAGGGDGSGSFRSDPIGSVYKSARVGSEGASWLGLSPHRRRTPPPTSPSAAGCTELDLSPSGSRSRQTSWLGLVCTSIPIPPFLLGDNLFWFLAILTRAMPMGFLARESQAPLIDGTLIGRFLFLILLARPLCPFFPPHWSIWSSPSLSSAASLFLLGVPGSPVLPSLRSVLTSFGLLGEGGDGQAGHLHLLFFLVLVDLHELGADRIVGVLVGAGFGIGDALEGLGHLQFRFLLRPTRAVGGGDGEGDEVKHWVPIPIPIPVLRRECCMNIMIPTIAFWRRLPSLVK